jgi:hypothetical protein
MQQACNAAGVVISAVTANAARAGRRKSYPFPQDGQLFFHIKLDLTDNKEQPEE